MNLVKRIQSADEGTTIELQENHDLTDAPRRINPETGVTIDGNGYSISVQKVKKGILMPKNPDFTIRNVEFIGDRTGWDVEDDWAEASMAIWLRGSNATVENCDFRKWGHAGIGVGFAPEGYIINPDIVKCGFFNNMHEGLGYGIVVHGGRPQIDECEFDGNRHSIATGGEPESGYEVSNFYQGPNNRIFGFEKHADSGSQITIRDGIFNMQGTCVAFRGTTREMSYVKRCWFKESKEPSRNNTSETDKAIIQYNHGSTNWENLRIEENHFGSDRPQWLENGQDADEPSDQLPADETEHQPMSRLQALVNLSDHAEPLIELAERKDKILESIGRESTQPAPDDERYNRLESALQNLEFPHRWVGPEKPTGQFHGNPGWGNVYGVYPKAETVDSLHFGTTEVHAREAGEMTVAVYPYAYDDLDARIDSPAYTRDFKLDEGHNVIDLDVELDEGDWLLTRVNGPDLLVAYGYGRNALKADSADGLVVYPEVGHPTNSDPTRWSGNFYNFHNVSIAANQNGHR